jgi:ligand-binding sensor domain-containing protein
MKDGLPNIDITTIMEDKTGKLWFGTRGDACFYDACRTGREKNLSFSKTKTVKPFTTFGR